MNREEQILKENVIGVNREKLESHHDFTPSVKKAMREYAREMSIGFARWLSGEGWQQYDEADRWICPTNNYNVITTDKLYDKYLDHLESLNKKP
jgi:hypothetical protein